MIMVTIARSTAIGNDIDSDNDNDNANSKVVKTGWL